MYVSFESTMRMRFSAARSRAWRSAISASSFGEKMRTTDGLKTHERFLPWRFAQ